MSYIGTEDSGDAQKSNRLADHGLVFMFVPFAETYAQPIGVVASRGPTKGNRDRRLSPPSSFVFMMLILLTGVHLARLVIQALILLEEAGAIVDGVVCDGAATNRAMWNQLGISGRLDSCHHYFEHPVDGARKVYVFSDVPHLVKCARNRLLSQKYLKFNGRWVKWEHYVTLFNMDNEKPSQLRVCQKISS